MSPFTELIIELTHKLYRDLNGSGNVEIEVSDETFNAFVFSLENASFFTETGSDISVYFGNGTVRIKRKKKICKECGQVVRK